MKTDAIVQINLVNILVFLFKKSAITKVNNPTTITAGIRYLFGNTLKYIITFTASTVINTKIKDNIL